MMIWTTNNNIIIIVIARRRRRKELRGSSFISIRIFAWLFNKTRDIFSYKKSKGAFEVY